MQKMATDSITPLAFRQGQGGRSRFAKLGMATDDVLNQAYRDILEMEVPPSLIYNRVKESPHFYKRLHPDQELLLINAKHSGYKKFDISLTYALIRNICKNIPKPTKRKWGVEPAAGEVTVGDDVERIRSIQNKLTARVLSASTPQSEFDDTWSTMSDICKRLETFTGEKYLEQLNVIQDLTFIEDLMEKNEVLTNLSSWKDRWQIASSMDDDDIHFLSKKSEEVIEPVLQETAPSLSLQEQFPLPSRLYQRRNAICGSHVMRWDETDILTEKKEKRKTFSGMMSDISRNKGMSTKTRNLYPLDDFLSKKLDSVEEVKERRELVRQETTPSVRLQQRLPLNNRAFTEKTIKINLQKHQNTFGFSISGGVEKKQPVTVFQVTIGSAADVCDLQMKDIILSVNRRDASYMRLSQVQHIINNAARTGRVELKIKREIGDDLDNPKEDLLQHMQTEETTVRHARGIVVGCAGAGKTTLLYSLIGKSLDEIKKVKSTRGLQVYEHIFTVTDGSLHATENLERKFLVRVPRSLLTKKNDKNEDADQKEKDNTGDLSKLDSKCDSNNSKLHGTNDICEEKTETLGPEENNINLTSDVKVEDHSTTALDTKAKDTVAETLSQEVIKKILDAQENEISVSMFDFAGQFAYYACHQIYMRSSAFYILVMDMAKSFEEFVISEEEEQTGSVFTTWKYKDYVQFWLNSIKSFGGPEAPVLIAATHTGDRTEDDIDDFFKCLWRSLPEEDNTWLRKHQSKKDEFAFELININEGERMQKLQSLKNSLVEVVSNKLDTKIPVPSSWALLEHLLQDSGKPIVSFEEIQEMNRKVHEQYRLESEKEILKFLTFFHDHGILLYFKGEATSTHAILSLQWFSDAFSRLIADIKHISIDCKRQHIKKWELFNKTGELNSTLVDALWKNKKMDLTNVRSYIEYKIEIMSYMERLQMLVSIGDTGKGQSWYVPCMNKKPFTKDIIKAYTVRSSIVCFQFTSFAIFVFYRLVAYCMGSLKWKVVPDKTDKCLFQTAAVFEFKSHKILLGICDTDIQLQVVKISDIETEISCEVGRLIEKGLHELTQTFENTNLSFKRGYKCQKIFCDENNKSFMQVEGLCQFGRENSDCSWCPIEAPHTINIQETRRFWEQNLKETENCTTTSQFPLESAEGRELQRSEPFRKDRDDSYPLAHTQIIGKYEIEKRVGRIQYTGGRGVGTGFRVGSKYVMTAYHVMGDKLEKLWREVHKLLTKEERKKMEWTKDKLPVTGGWNISNLISSLDPKKKAKVEGLAEDLTETYEIKFEFLKEGAVGRIVKIKHDIAFVSPENDVLILELAELESEPKFFNLVEYNISEEKIHMFGHPDGILLQHDPGCTIINKETELNELKKEGIAFFKKEWPEKEREIIDDYAPCVISDDSILFHSSSSTAHGASGAPLTIVDKGTLKVYGMLLNGHPKIFYNYSTKKDIKRPDLLVESGISMKKVRSLLESCLPEEFVKELFRKK